MNSMGPNAGGTSRRRRSRTGSLILAAFLIVPLVELAIAIQVGRWIGVLPTILILLAEAVIGAWIVRREGAAAWRALVTSLESGRAPTRELADAALVLIGGTLLLTPGFLTDLLGFVLIIPITRAPARRLLTTAVADPELRRLPGRPVRRRTGCGGAGRTPGRGHRHPEGPRQQAGRRNGPVTSVR
jgi:UPF0716 protein FxsA